MAFKSNCSSQGFFSTFSIWTVNCFLCFYNIIRIIMTSSNYRHLSHCIPRLKPIFTVVRNFADCLHSVLLTTLESCWHAWMEFKNLNYRPLYSITNVVVCPAEQSKATLHNSSTQNTVVGMKKKEIVIQVPKYLTEN